MSQKIDPLTKAAQEVDEVVGAVRQAAPVLKRAAQALTELAGMFTAETPPPAPARLPYRRTDCPTCGGGGVLGIEPHTIVCPVCRGGR